MTRKLPWVTETSTATSRPKNTSTIPRPAKRSRVEEPASNGDGPTVSAKNVKGKGKGRELSTSPPPEPPVEVFMDEGLEHDDKYRIVEDEFLGIAKRFTVHLHAAEYKRQEKLVKARNAEAINSISRPVIGKIPDHTRRKVRSVARSKGQRSALEGLLGQQADTADESDDSAEGLPYLGTTLHGLMDSPRQKAISLAKFRGAVATTRAAAGYQRPLARTNKTKGSESPQAKVVLRSVRRSENRQESSTESSDEDDDLDAPIPAPKLASLRASVMNNLNSKPVLSQPTVAPSRGAPKMSQSTPMGLSETFPSIASQKSPVRALTSPEAPKIISRVERRLQHARQRKAKEESEQKKKKLDIIPSFF